MWCLEILKRLNDEACEKHKKKSEDWLVSHPVRLGILAETEGGLTLPEKGRTETA